MSNKEKKSFNKIALLATASLASLLITANVDAMANPKKDKPVKISNLGYQKDSVQEDKESIEANNKERKNKVAKGLFTKFEEAANKKKLKQAIQDWRSTRKISEDKGLEGNIEIENSLINNNEIVSLFKEKLIDNLKSVAEKHPEGDNKYGRAADYLLKLKNLQPTDIDTKTEELAKIVDNAITLIGKEWGGSVSQVNFNQLKVGESNIGYTIDSGMQPLPGFSPTTAIIEELVYKVINLYESPYNIRQLVFDNSDIMSSIDKNNKIIPVHESVWKEATIKETANIDGKKEERGEITLGVDNIITSEGEITSSKVSSNKEGSPTLSPKSGSEKKGADIECLFVDNNGGEGVLKEKKQNAALDAGENRIETMPNQQGKQKMKDFIERAYFTKINPIKKMKEVVGEDYINHKDLFVINRDFVKNFREEITGYGEKLTHVITETQRLGLITEMREKAAEEGKPQEGDMILKFLSLIEGDGKSERDFTLNLLYALKPENRNKEILDFIERVDGEEEAKKYVDNNSGEIVLKEKNQMLSLI